MLHSMYASGFRNFILYSGHASALEMAALEEAAERVLAAWPQANVALVLEYDVILKRGAGLYDTPGDLHAGEIETSRILTVRPDLVRMDLAPEKSGRESARPMLVRDVRRYWPSSVAGAPRLATAEKGERLGAVVGEFLAELVRTMETTPPH
jgi:creatinine amidohydrolase